MHKGSRNLLQAFTRGRVLIPFLILGGILSSFMGVLYISPEDGFLENRKSLTLSKNDPRTAADPDYPNITLVNPPLNNSAIQKPLSGFFTFMIDVAGNGTDGHAAKMVDGMDPQLEIDNVVYNFTDMSGGNFTSFCCDWPITGYGDRDLIWAKINATNNNSLTTTIFLNVTIDAVSPLCIVTNPTTYENVSYNTIINVTATDDYSGIDYVYLTIYYLNAPFTIFNGIPIQNQGGDWWEYNWNVYSQPLVWLPGYYNLSFEICDLAGNFNHTNVTVLVDCNAPALDFWNPVNNSAISNDVTFEVVARDYGTGVKNVTIQFNSQNEVLMTRQSTYTYSYTYPTGNRNENFLVTIRAYDYSGLVNTSLGNFTIDNTLPTVSFIGTTNIAGMANFTLDCSDANGIDNIRWRLNNSAYKQLNISSQQNIITYLAFSSLNYQDGYYNLQICINDTADNELIISRTLFIDNTPPQISVRNLRDGLVISTTFTVEVCVYETLSENITFKYKINNNDWEDYTSHRVPGTNYWYIPLGSLPELRSGDNQITLRAYNLAGGYDEDSYYFLITIPPAFDWWILVFLAGGIVAIYGIVKMSKKFWKTSQDYHERLETEVKRIKEQKAIEANVTKEITKIDLGAPGGLFKKPKKPEEG